MRHSLFRFMRKFLITIFWDEKWKMRHTFLRHRTVFPILLIISNPTTDQCISVWITRSSKMPHCQQGLRLRLVAQHVKELNMIVPYLKTTLQDQLGPIFSGTRVMHDLLVTFQVRGIISRDHNVAIISVLERVAERMGWSPWPTR